MESIFGSENPFEKDQLQSAFYHPTQPKNVDFDDKKICLSPGMTNKNANQHGESKMESNKFLALSHAILKDEIPTKENGAVVQDTSGSTKFDETWPSTELTNSTLSPNIGESQSVPKVASEAMLQNWIDKNTASKPEGSRSIIASYIDRFRNEPPKSREQRDKEAFADPKVDEFWWAAPPSNASTPKESDNSSVSPYQLKNGKRDSSKPPVLKKQTSKLFHTQSHGRKVITDFSHVADLETDSETARIQNRAEKLLELSESTLTNYSSERESRSLKDKDSSSPKNKTIPLPFHQQPSNTPSEPRLLANHPKLKPEDDILYQWRLARKLERATSSENPFTKLPYPKIDASSTSRGLPSFRGVTQGESKEKTQREPVKHDAGRDSNMVQPVPAERVMMDVEVSRKHDKSSATSEHKKNSSSQTAIHYNHPLSQCVHDFQHAEIAAHMHTACDILPCPHQSNNRRRKTPSRDYDLQRDTPLLNCPRQEEILDLLNHGNNLQLSAPVYGFVDNNFSIKSNQGSKNLSRDLPKRQSSLNEKQSVLNSEKSNFSTRSCNRTFSNGAETKEKTRKNLKNNLKDRKQDRLVVEQSTKAPDHQQMTSNDKRSNEAPSSNVGNVIQEVVTSHLFSSSTSIDLQSTSDKDDNSDFISHCSDRDESDRNVSTNNIETLHFDDESDGEFPDDDILQILRNRRRKYLESLRQIEVLLESFGTDRLQIEER